MSWIRKDRWDQLPKEKREKFAPICPDFVIEIRSKTDSIQELKAKMEEYRENGCRLGWLIDRIEKTVFIYREKESIEILTGEQVTLWGEAVLEGFEVMVVL